MSSYSIRQLSLNILRQMVEISELGQLPSFEKRIGQFQRRFEDEEFRIAVIGEFSSGKSTFINALIGQDILSHATTETTATITRLINVSPNDKRCGKCCVKFHDGQTIYMNNLEQLKDYTTTQSQKFQVAKDVTEVELWLSFIPYTTRPVVIVDTPGLNGTAEGHQEQTMELVGQAHACIFLIPRRGLDENSLTFLHLLTQVQRNFIFIQNFIDDLNPAEGETLEQVLDQQAQIIHRQIFSEDANNEKQGVQDNGKLPPHQVLGQLRYKLCGVSALQALAARDTHIKTVYQDNTQELDDTKRAQLYKKSRFGEFLEILSGDLQEGQLEQLQYGDAARALCIWLGQITEQLKQEEQQARRVCAYSAEGQVLSRLNQLEEKIYSEQESQEQKLKNFVIDRSRQLYQREREHLKEELEILQTKLSREASGQYKVEDLNQWREKLPDQLQLSLSRQISEMNKRWLRRLQLLWQLLLQQIRKYGDIEVDDLKLNIPRVEGADPSFNVFNNDDDIKARETELERRQNDFQETERKIKESQKNLEKQRQAASKAKLEYESQKDKADIEKRTLGERPLAQIREKEVKVKRGGLGILDAILGPKYKTIEYTDDSRGRAWDEKQMKLNDMRRKEEELRQKAAAAQRALKRCQDERNDEIKRQDYLQIRINDLEREIRELKETREKEEKLAKQQYLNLSCKRINEQLTEYLFGEDGAQQRIEEWLEKRMRKEAGILEEQTIQQFRNVVRCKLKWIDAVRNQKTPEVMKQAQALANICKVLEQQKKKLEEELK